MASEADESTPGGQAVAPARGGRRRHYTGVTGRLITALCALVTLYALLYVGGILARLDIRVWGGIHRATILTFVLVALFLFFPATKGAPRNRLPWYDGALILLSLISGGYLAVNAIRIAEASLPANPLEQVLALVLVALVLEGARRSVSWIYSFIGILFLAYPFYAQYLPGLLHGARYSLMRVTTMVYMNSEVGINGHLMHLLATIIIVFVTFGAFLELSGAGKFFIDLALVMMGRFRGGPAKVAVLASAFFGTMSGNGVANVATTGVITIPLMKSIGYRPHFAGAVEAVASTGGAIMPPVMAATAFVMADFLGITYWEVCVAAFVPAVLYYLALMIMVDFEAARNSLRGLPREQIPSLRQTLANGWFWFVPIAVLIVFLVGLHYEAPTAGIYALISVVVVSFLGKKENRMGPRRIVAALSQGVKGILEVGAALAVAGMLVSSLALTGLGIKLTGALVLMAEGNQFILVLLAAVVSVIMGMAVGPMAVYITLALVVAPALISAGILPMAAHLFLIFLATAALITPPVCTVAFVAATIADANFMRTGYTAARLGIVAFLVPFIFVYSPELLLIGSPGAVILAVVTAAVGVYLLSAGLQGYLLREVGFVARLLLIGGGVAMIIPGWQTDLAGVAAGAAVLVWQMKLPPVRIRPGEVAADKPD